MKSTLLTGRQIAVIGLGDLGAALATVLVAAGARVVGVRRGGEAPPGVTLLRADLARPDTLTGLPIDLDAVVVSVTPDAYDIAGYTRTYLDGARNLACALAERSLRRLFWVSSTRVYGGAETEVLDESAPARPESEHGRILLAAEEALRSGAWPVTAVRLAGIYGPGRNALIERVRSGRGAPAQPPQWTNRIHRDDAVAILSFLLERTFAGEPVPDVVIGSDGAQAPLNEVLEWLAGRLGVRLTQVESGRGPGRRLRPRVLQELGFRWRYPDYRAGYAALLDSPDG